MLQCKTKQDVMKAVKEHKVSFIQFWFTDVLAGSRLQYNALGT